MATPKSIRTAMENPIGFSDVDTLLSTDGCMCIQNFETIVPATVLSGLDLVILISIHMKLL